MVRLSSRGMLRTDILPAAARRARCRRYGASSVSRLAAIDEGKLLGIGLDKEIERIDHGHLGREIDLDAELGGLFRKDEARQPVAVRVLLPVDEMLRRA